MSGKKRTEAWNRTRKAADKAADQLKPMAAQMKPLAESTKQAAKRQIFRTRTWAAPQVERTGKVVQDKVAPKVSSMLSSAAERIDPAKPRHGRWRKPVGVAAAIAAAASAAAAVFRNRMKTGATDTTDTTGSTDDTGDRSGASSMNGAGDATSPDGEADREVGEHEARAR